MSPTWRSKRLVYRAVEKEDETGILQKLQADYDGIANASPMLFKPQSKKDTELFRSHLDKMLLCNVVCIDPSTTADKDAEPTPIGIVAVQSLEDGQAHHRRSVMGINIYKDYQGQGYGTEALYWGLDWAFSYANLHRIELDAYGANAGAIRLYERMGFTIEGRLRDYIFIHGKYWDAVIFSMLEDEWRAMREEKLGIAKSAD